MSEKKRKRASQGSDEVKRRSIANEISVSVEPSDPQWLPILATAPGISLSRDIQFSPYVDGTRFHLHSAHHPRLDTLASEPLDAGNDHLQHFVGIYDEATQQLRLLKAKPMVVRTSLKSARRPSIEQTTTSTRVDLGLAFGTKKAQKAIRSVTANAISPAKPSRVPTELDATTTAILSSIAETGDAATREQLEKLVDESKPRPPLNINATSPQEVFSLDQLVDGEANLQKMRIKEWVDGFADGAAEQREAEGKQFGSRSTYVANNMGHHVQRPDNLRMVRVLRYLELMIRWSREGLASTSTGKSGKKAYPLGHKAISSLVSTFGSDVVENLRLRFAGSGTMTKLQLDNLITHMLALTLVIDGFVTEPSRIQFDLGLDSRNINKYYRELGCSVRTLTKAEADRRKMKELDGGDRKLVELKIPLNLPKLRVPATRKR